MTTISTEAAAEAAADQPTEFCVVLDGENVVVGFESWEQADAYARSTWGYQPDGPAICVAVVSRLADWQGGAL